MIKKMDEFKISDYLKNYGFELVGRNDSSKVLYFKNKDVDEIKGTKPEKDYALVVYPTFENEKIVYGQYYSFMGFIPFVKGAFTSPTYPNLTIDVELECTSMAFEEDYKAVLFAMNRKE